MENVELLEPERLYKSQLKAKHNDGVCSFFEELTKESGVNIEENRVSVKQYKEACQKLEESKKALSKGKTLKTFMIVLIVLGGIFTVLGIVGFVVNVLGLAIGGLVGGIALLVTGIVVLAVVAKKKIKSAKQQIEIWTKKSEELYAICKSQMDPLNNLFEDSIPQQIMQKTTPLLQMDRFFSTTKMEQLVSKYGYVPYDSKDISVQGIQSGSILGNPWTFIKKLNTEIYEHTYEGTLTISWTTTVRSSNGGSSTVTHTQTLHAYVKKPAPRYWSDVTLVYGNEAAPHLHFTRKPSEINKFKDQDKIDHYVRSHEKELTKLANKAMKKGGTYTPLGNSEFELFFGGLDRDHEVEYRLLFTPLAQKSMLELLKSKEAYGDDFSFVKDGMINEIVANHAQNNVIFLGAEDFKGYDYDEMKARFIALNNEYFKSLYFTMAPLLCIPLYQQTKTREYIYQGTIPSNFTSYEHDIAANAIGSNQFAHEDTKTDVILRTEYIGKDGNADKIKVTAYSYDTKKHVEFVPVMGGDGHFHNVPVEWIEYIPLENEGFFAMEDSNESSRRLFSSKLDSNNFGKFLENNTEGNKMVFDRGIISYPINIESASLSVSALKQIMKK